MAGTKMPGDIGVSSTSSTTGTKMAGDMGVSNKGKTVMNMGGDIVVTIGGDDVDFPGDL